MKAKSRNIIERDVSEDAVLMFPDGMTTHKVSGQYLVLSPETANWLVLDKQGYEVFSCLDEGKNIAYVVKKFGEETTRAVITQIMAKEFTANATVETKQNLKCATLYMTMGCNLRCKTCYLKAENPGANECSGSDIMAFLSNFKKFGGEVVTLSGGEPMIRHDLPSVIMYAKEIGLEVVLLTNGTLIGNDNYKMLSQNCNEIQISIDGPCEEAHDFIRGKGTFKQSMNALTLLAGNKGRKCRLSVAMTPTPETLQHFKEKLRSFAKSVRKIRQDIIIRVTPMLMEGRSIGCLSKEQQDAFSKKVVLLCNEELECGWFDMLDAGAIVPNRKLLGCGIGDSFVVTAEGKVKACGLAPTTVGTIRADFGILIKKLNNIAARMSVDNTMPCQKCDLRYFCGGGCRLEAIRSTESSFTIHCTQAFRDQWYEKLVRINPFVYEVLGS
jgi:radical SAM protein with 4Fe4S-binding SPASM domain